MVKSEIKICNKAAALELSCNSSCNKSRWTVLRSFVDNITRTFALSLIVSRIHSEQFDKPNAYIGKHTLTEPAAFSQHVCSLAPGNKVAAHTIDDIIEQVRIAADMGTNILRLQQHARAYADASWQRYERSLRHAEHTTALATTRRMAIDCSSAGKGDGRTLAARICQDLLAPQTTLSGCDTLALDAPLCSSSVIMQWIEQQRQYMARMSQDGELRTPVLLDLSYRGCCADDRSVVLLDNSIKVSESGVYLRTDQQAVAQRAGATVMVSAIRAAASLALPVNLTAVMPLDMPLKPCSLSIAASATPSLATPAVAAEKDCILILNLCYEPQSVCDLESFGTHSSITLIFNTQFPIWRHYHSSRDESTGQLAPLWLLLPRSQATTANDATLPQGAITHADCSGASIQDLVNLAAHNVVPHMIWSNRANRPLRSMVHFLRGCSFSVADCAGSSRHYAQLMNGVASFRK